MSAKSPSPRLRSLDLGGREDSLRVQHLYGWSFHLVLELIPQPHSICSPPDRSKTKVVGFPERQGP